MAIGSAGMMLVVVPYMCKGYLLESLTFRRLAYHDDMLLPMYVNPVQVFYFLFHISKLYDTNSIQI